MKSVAARKANGGSREKSNRQRASKQSRKPTTAPGSESRHAKGPGLDAAALGDVIDDLRGIKHVLGTASPLVEQARQIAFTMICDHPEQRDALARLGHRLTGGDIDRIGPHNLRLIDDDLLEGVIQAADSVIDAALWRLDRLRCVLARASQNAKSRK